MVMKPIEVLFLGSGDAFGSGGRFQACISVRTPADRFLLDCGGTSLMVSKILVSHLHGDHFGGIPFFVLDAQLVRTATAIDGIVATAFPVINASGATPYALRVEAAGRVIAYSGDTEWTPALVEAARDADLFICEACFFDKKAKGHLDYSTFLSRRGDFSCGSIVVTHMSGDMLARSCEIEDIPASDGLRVSL